MLFKGKDLNIANQGLEQQLVREAEMKPVNANGEVIFKESAKGEAFNDVYQTINFKDFPLSQYFYGRPNFINLIDHMLPNNYHTSDDPQSKKLKYDPPFPEWLYSTCRGILDSKYNEYLLYEDFNFPNVSRLTEFVYSWLGRFCLDPLTRQIRLLEFDEREQADKLRLQFAIGMQSVKAQKIWEYQLFNDFLQEKYSNDELYFYLHCRHILFKGPQLLDSVCTHERIYNIDVRKVRQAIEVLFFKMGAGDRSMILDKVIAMQKEFNNMAKPQKA